MTGLKGTGGVIRPLELRSINYKILLEWALDNKTNMSGMLYTRKTIQGNSWREVVFRIVS